MVERKQEYLPQGSSLEIDSGFSFRYSGVNGTPVCHRVINKRLEDCNESTDGNF